MRIWLMAARPRTLPAAIAPVLVGTAAAVEWVGHLPRWGAFLAALVGSIFIQIGTNLANDYSDARRGADTADRLGPVRVTSAGLVTPQRVLNATWVAFAVAVACGIYLATVAGAVILLIGAVSIAAGILYTGGPRPYGYAGLGEVFVFLFFGLVAVNGSYYVQVEQLDALPLGLSIAVGFLSTAILVVNNVRDLETDEIIAELLEPDVPVLLAKGGDGGFGNLHFKTSTNRAPRQKTPGWPGEVKKIKMELRVLADVGLLGQPNAGKSTLIAAVSNARPKIADYPFTTLYPNLGVVRVGPEKSFVIADIPGLIEGAAEGAGLGHQFLRHLQRTRVLLHVVDLAPFNPDVDPVAEAKAIVKELKKYDEALYDKPRWLVLNKLDMVPAEERAARVKDFVKRYKWKGPVFEISALTREGCEPLIRAIYDHVAAIQSPPVEDPDARFDAPTIDPPKAFQETRKTRATKAKAIKAAKAEKAEKAEKPPERDPRFDPLP